MVSLFYTYVNAIYKQHNIYYNIIKGNALLCPTVNRTKDIHQHSRNLLSKQCTQRNRVIHKTVQRFMKDLGLVCHVPIKNITLTDDLNQEFWTHWKFYHAAQMGCSSGPKKPVFAFGCHIRFPSPANLAAPTSLFVLRLRFEINIFRILLHSLDFRGPKYI